MPDAKAPTNGNGVETTTRKVGPAILADPASAEAFAGLADAGAEEGSHALRAIAKKIGANVPAPADAIDSDIPAGATYLAQFAVHDLDLRGREDVAGVPRMDLSLIYGDGPKHDAAFYQVPEGPGRPRSALRLGRARPGWNSPAWGAARDLPRAACPHLDVRGIDARSEVLIPNALSDSNLILGQVQTIWALLHNAAIATLAERRSRPDDAFEAARAIVRHVYRCVLVNDVLGSWLLPKLRPRYVRDTPQRLSEAPLSGVPRAFVDGVARIGHALVRDAYDLNDRRRFEGLRDIIRHTGTGRPMDMPLTEDWLLDFSRFFDIGGVTAQRARAIGPRTARAFALGGFVGLDAPTPTDGLVLRDLVACTRSGSAAMPAVRTLVDRIEAASPGLLEGCLAHDEDRVRTVVAAWLADVGLPQAQVDALAKDPPIILFLMLEARQDANGKSLGGLGSVLMAETFAAALPAAASDEALEEARNHLFRGPVPTRMEGVIRFLQARYQFADGARLHPGPASARSGTTPAVLQPTERTMLDDKTHATPEGIIEVADYIELGRIVTEWAKDKCKRPDSIEALAAQLKDVARIPPCYKKVEFVEGSEETLVIRLPEKRLTEDAMSALDTPLVSEPYPLPKFYDDVYQKHFGPQMTPLEIFLARMGDYTIARCR